MESVLPYILTILFGAAIYFIAKYKPSKEVFDKLKEVAVYIKMVIEHWNLSSLHKLPQLYTRFLFVGRLAAAGRDIKELDETIVYLAEEASRIALEDKDKKHRLNHSEKRKMATIYMAVVEFDDLLETLKTITNDHQNVNVKKATLLAIDIIGELVDLRDELGQDYFQSIIYGINKALKIIKNQGLSEKSVKKVSFVLFRVYKLTSAYRHLRGEERMTKYEFYQKVITILSSARDLVGLY